MQTNTIQSSSINNVSSRFIRKYEANDSEFCKIKNKHLFDSYVQSEFLIINSLNIQWCATRRESV